MAQDLRYSLRMLAKSPGFTAVAVITLALGIGANTAIFTLIDAVLLKMLPIQHPEQLVLLSRTKRASMSSFSYPIFEQFRDHNQVFSGVLAASRTPLSLGVSTETEPAEGQYVSGNFFVLLGVRPLIGRTITPDDDRISEGGGSPVAVISYGLWQRRFGRDASIVGKKITVEETPFTVIGVTPPEFFGLQVGTSTDFWIPMAMEPRLRPNSWLDKGNFGWLSVVGRLKPGVSLEQARANLDLIFKEILTERAGRITNSRQRQDFLSQQLYVTSASSGLSKLRDQFSEPLLILMAVVGLVLLIACANIANLLLARAAARKKEIAVRLAIGAGRWRLIRQLLTESVLLAVLGGLAGLLFASWGSAFLVTFMSNGNTPLALDLHPDVRILVFTSAVSLLTAILFGLAPAVHATQVDAGPTLKENARAFSGRRSGVPLGKILVVSQVALSLLLLAGAGLFVRSLRNLETTDAGFNRENVLLASVNPAKAGYQGAQLTTFYQQLLERLQRIPGVRSAGLSWLTPIGGGGVDLSATVEGYTPQPNEDNSVYVNAVSPGYFETLGTPLLLGRDFDARDSQSTTKVALINEAMSKYYFHGANPIGRRVTLGREESLQIVGVVKDAKYMTLREQVHRTVYKNCLQDKNLGISLTLGVRTIDNPAGIAAALRNEVHALADNIPVTNIRTFAAQVYQSLIQERLIASLSGFFGVLAALLACLGLYGVMGYAVARRTNEIGIRMALGAREDDVMWMVLRETLLLVLIGVAIGVPAALAATRLASSLISGLLFGLKAADPTTIASATLLMAVVALLAGYLPARRATKVDPMVALRCE